MPCRRDWKMPRAPLKLDFQKDVEGYLLMRRMSRPRQPTKKRGSERRLLGRRARDARTPCSRIASAMWKPSALYTIAFHRCLPFEQRLWELDAVINRARILHRHRPGQGGPRRSAHRTEQHQRRDRHADARRDHQRQPGREDQGVRPQARAYARKPNQALGQRRPGARPC